MTQDQFTQFITKATGTPDALTRHFTERPKCIHLGVLAETPTASCQNLWKHRCEKGHGTVQRAMQCATCKDHEADDSDPRAQAIEASKQKLLLINKLCPGDTLVMTAAVEMLHQQYPGRFLTGVKSNCDAVWEHNPHITPMDLEADVRPIEMHYPLIGDGSQRPTDETSSNSGQAFLRGYVKYLGDQLGLRLNLTRPNPALYLSDEEKNWLPQVAERMGRRCRYWVINAGYKIDYTAKHYPFWQEVVNLLRGQVLFVQVGSKEKDHFHTPLEGVIDLRGQTDQRQLIRLCYHAAGGVGPVTFLQHIMAAFSKPYVCLLGAREPVSWVTYPVQTTLHAIGALDCCRENACWVSRVAKLDESDTSAICHQPAPVPTGIAPRCMTMIQPEEVANAILRYEMGRLPIN